MTDARDDDIPERTREELERLEAQFFAELVRAKPVPVDRDVVRTEVVFAVATEDFTLNDALALSSHYLEGEPRVSHALILWMGVRKEPTHVLEW